MLEKNPKISIITIVYNNVRDIRYTLESVAKQDYSNIEYIIVDGLSSDGTLAIIEEYKAHIQVLISEKDNGIYDAMNKGLHAATGDYVLFLNSGDELFATDTLTKVFNSASDADIYYGETKLVNEDRQIIGDRRHACPEHFDWTSFKYGMNVCHQAIYVKRDIAEPYDLQYKLSSDIDWVIRAAKKAKKIVNVRGYVAKYLVGGMSQQRHKQSLKERYEIFKRYYGFLPNLFNHGVIAFRLMLYRLKNGKTRD
ncbi:glycosyltransferase [Sphingobacterium sp. DK4209]|uniref:Glycosyltransferase n=1 Tax=Sphingobacterium zhuxiongii TaxID=2662364 RepID=A0A5Q0Q6I9_9SPHI|nr:MULTISPECIES: glycosyltransferase family 2 protein [unclassified Sphingobacterium]MVZ66301.1 glycosyltransferase [Sphingobacterium sp. DK4209]QGA25083.1 glycosyltransferase [Sphingobacterium sp. dk4302]